MTPKTLFLLVFIPMLVFVAGMILVIVRARKMLHQREAKMPEDVSLYYYKSCLATFSTLGNGLCPECKVNKLVRLDKDGRRILKSVGDGEIEI